MFSKKFLSTSMIICIFASIAVPACFAVVHPVGNRLFDLSVADACVESTTWYGKKKCSANGTPCSTNYGDGNCESCNCKITKRKDPGLPPLEGVDYQSDSNIMRK